MSIHFEQLRLAFLTNYLPPSHLPVMRLLQQALPNLRIFLSTPMGRERQWQPEWQGLRVTVQRALNIKSSWRHPRFREDSTVYLPYDTLWQLQRFSPDVIVSAQLGLLTLLSKLFLCFYPISRFLT